MKQLFIVSLIMIFFISCKDEVVLPSSSGKDNQILVVMKESQWSGETGDEFRNVFGEHLVGLPQPEVPFSVSQIDPRSLNRMMKLNRNLLIFGTGKKSGFYIKRNVYAAPQTIVYVTAENKKGFAQQIKDYGKEIIKAFKESDIKVVQNRFRRKRLDDSKYKTFQNLGISLTIPKEFRTVDDSGDFLWLRQHLSSGIARGDGTNNILVYTLPLTKETLDIEDITVMRDSIGKQYIPGSEEGMYMITEKAYTPFIYNTKVDGKKAYETRGKWEVKNDFMAGPFLNYAVVDKKNNRIIVVEGFTYAPAVNKRDFIFELEAIARSLRIQ